MAPCLVSDKGLLDLKDFYSKIEKYINRSSLYIQALMVHIGIDKLTYSEEVAYQRRNSSLMRQMRSFTQQ